MIKLKKLIKESVWDRKFGESLPTLSSVMEKHQKKLLKVREARLQYDFNIKAKPRIWRTIKSDIAKQIEQLVKIGEDYEVFQSAKYTAKTLKQIQRLWSKLG